VPALVKSPPQRVLLVVAYPDINRAPTMCPRSWSISPSASKAFDDLLVGYTRTKGIQPPKVSLVLPEVWADG